MQKPSHFFNKSILKPPAWETIIGLETHVQLSTRSKIFSGSSNKAYFDTSPNTQANEVDLALPGTLPAINRVAVEHAIRFGLATGAKVAQHSVFSRKNYFYPDLPKGYQISQYENPILSGGEVTFFSGGKETSVRLIRSHLEEDAGKLLHGSYTLENGLPASGIDLNRAGTALLEIVTEPDIRTTDQAVDYSKALRSLVVWLGICDGNMQEGSLRFDVNISVRKLGEKNLNTRTEIKNLNSFRFLERSILFESQRQIELLQSGSKVVQETRLYDPDRNETRSMRDKENAQDYRYFPDPDLPTLIISPAWIENIRFSLPELPLAKRKRFEIQYQLTSYDASYLTQDHEIAVYFEKMMLVLPEEQAKLAVNWMMGELSAKLHRENKNIKNSPIPAYLLAELIKLITGGTISNKVARQVFSAMWIGEESGQPSNIIEKYGLKRTNDINALRMIIDEILIDNQSAVSQYRAGKKKAMNLLVGKVMQASKGKADPKDINTLLQEKLA